MSDLGNAVSLSAKVPVCKADSSQFYTNVELVDKRITSDYTNVEIGTGRPQSPMYKLDNEGNCVKKRPVPAPRINIALKTDKDNANNNSTGIKPVPKPRPPNKDIDVKIPLDQTLLINPMYYEMKIDNCLLSPHRAPDSPIIDFSNCSPSDTERTRTPDEIIEEFDPLVEKGKAKKKTLVAYPESIVYLNQLENGSRRTSTCSGLTTPSSRLSEEVSLYTSPKPCNENYYCEPSSLNRPKVVKSASSSLMNNPGYMPTEAQGNILLSTKIPAPDNKQSVEYDPQDRNYENAPALPHRDRAQPCFPPPTLPPELFMVGPGTYDFVKSPVRISIPELTTDGKPDLPQKTNKTQARATPSPPPQGSDCSGSSFRGSLTSLNSSVSEDTLSLPPTLPTRAKHRSPSWRQFELNIGGACGSLKNRLSGQTKPSTPSSDAKILHSGFLYKMGTIRKNFTLKWCSLTELAFMEYVDNKEEEILSTVEQKHIFSVGSLMNFKVSNKPDLCCFEVAILKLKGQFAFSTYAAAFPSERDEWIRKLITCFGPKFDHGTTSLDQTKALKGGYVYARFGLTGTWQPHWLLLGQTELTISSTSDQSVLRVFDLRKVIGLSTQAITDKINNPLIDKVIERGPAIEVKYPGQSIFIQPYSKRDTETWQSSIKDRLAPWGNDLDQLQLTADNIPVIIDSCLKFVSVHGANCEGIYRLSGSSSKIQTLWEAFEKDAFSVQLKTEDYTAHDVANVLKRLVRQLPDPIVTSQLKDKWIASCGIEDFKKRLGKYMKLLQQLPQINHNTLRQIVIHLASICELSKYNLMTVANIASIFGPCLFSSMNEESSDGYSVTGAKIDLLVDLITHHIIIFDVTIEEMAKERKIQQALQDLRDCKRVQKPAGDILVGMHIYNRDCGRSINIKLSPTMTAAEVCQLAVNNAKLQDPVDTLAVHEVVCSGEMERPLHSTELVLSCVLAWSKGDDSEAKGNYLVVKKNELYLSLMQYARGPVSMFSELKVADSSSKSFRKHLFEFKNARLACFKDAKQISNPIQAWNVEDITWYIGAEAKRNAPTKWAFTFIDRDSGIKRTKANPYFGRTVCCRDEEEFYKWIVALLLGEHSGGLFPKRESKMDPLI